MILTREAILARLPPAPDWHCCRCAGRNWSGNGYCCHCGGDEVCGNFDCGVCEDGAPPIGPFVRQISDRQVMRIRRAKVQAARARRGLR
jgi:hypothetical protein